MEADGAQARISRPTPEDSKTRTHDNLPQCRSLSRPDTGANTAPKAVLTATPAPNRVSDIVRSSARALATTAVPTIGKAPSAMVNTSTVISNAVFVGDDELVGSSDNSTASTLR